MSKNTSISALVGAGIALAAGLVLVPVAASAHVHIDPGDAPIAGGETTLTFGFNHGCDGSPTTAVEVSMPDGLSGVHPVAGDGWSVEVERGGEAGRVSTVTYTADTPIASDLRGEVRMLVGFADDAPAKLAFPVEQLCADGSESWSEIATDGEDPHSLEAPAPVLELTQAQPEQGVTEGQEDSAEETPGVLPLTLSGVAVVVSLAALGTAIARTRRRR